MLGEDNLALYYILFCVIGSLGALQFVAGKYTRRDLTLFSPRVAQIIGAGLVVFAFVWFFSARADLFIPGLAGGDFVAYAFLAFGAAYLVTRALVWIAARVRQVSFPTGARETESK
jgi:hypothetical protein